MFPKHFRHRISTIQHHFRFLAFFCDIMDMQMKNKVKYYKEVTKMLAGKISEKLTAYLNENKAIKEEQTELYLYCFSTFFEILFNLILTVLIGIILQELPATLIFLIVFIPLRRMCGGYHCDTETGCFILSIAIFLVVILTYKYLGYIPYIGICIVLAADLIVICIYSPVISVEKNISATDLVRYRRLSIAVSSAVILLSAVLSRLSAYGYVLTETITVISIFMIIGDVKYSPKTDVDLRIE